MRAAALSLALAVSACGAPPAATRAPAPTPTSTPSTTPTPAPTPTPVALDAGVGARIAALIEASGGEAAVVVADGRLGTVIYETKADEEVLSASLYKLWVLLEAESRLEDGSLKLDQTVTIIAADQRDGGTSTQTGIVLTIDDALERMITVSDNAAALALLRTFGVESIVATLAEEGLGGHRFHPSMTTARTVATFFGEVAQGELVSPAASQRMLSRLSRQRVNDRIPAALPAGVVLGHKTGNLSSVTHDAGLIRGPDGTAVVLVVLTWDSRTETGSQLIRDITAAVYEGLKVP